MVLFMLRFTCLSQSANYDFEPLDLQKVSQDIDTIKQEIDSTFFYINSTVQILKEEVKIFGLKKTVLINGRIFLPYSIIFGLYILWLFGRMRRRYRY